MIAINKSEKEAIKKAYPTAHVVRTMKQKSKRHHYFCEETKHVVEFLAFIRKSSVREVEGYNC